MDKMSRDDVWALKRAMNQGNWNEASYLMNKFNIRDMDVLEHLVGSSMLSRLHSYHKVIGVK